jgi:sugar fermentation stimulation protein A
MNYATPLQPAIFIKRYQRFFADIQLPDGAEVTAHCPNTGSMRNCQVPGSDCWYSRHEDPRRKLPYTLEYIRDVHGHLACINTHRANQVVGEALREGRLAELPGDLTVRPEVRLADSRSRLDFLVGEGTPSACYIEVKSVTLVDADGTGRFPDAPTTRGQKHLRELMSLQSAGYRTALLLVAMNQGMRRFQAAAEIDPEYARLLDEARDAGVSVWVYATRFDDLSMELTQRLL